MTLIITAFYKEFGGVIGLIIIWFGALVGPTAVPMILGLIPAFKHSDSKAAIASIVAGVLVFVLMKLFAYDASQAMILALPTILSVIVYVGMGLANRKEQVPEKCGAPSPRTIVCQYQKATVDHSRQLRHHCRFTERRYFIRRRAA